jgi:glycosyl transferase family 25
MNRFEFNKINTFCISLISNTERQRKMKRRLEELKLDVTFWKAVTKENINRVFPDYLNDGAKGCGQSHFEIWEHIIQNDINYALILEDDACFDKNFFEKLEQFRKDINDYEWDAIFLNASESIPILNKWLLSNEQYLTGGYIISKRGCLKIVNMFSNCLCSSDWMTSRLQLFNHSYCYFPWLIIQEGNESTIGSNVDADHEKVVRLLNEINYSIENYNI